MTTDPRIYGDQFAFQRKYSYGRILNVGCNTDGAGLAAMGAVNLDLGRIDNLGQPMPVNVIADARALPFGRAFDTVVVGELLEHMERDGGVTTLREARAALANGGRVVITMPHDGRRETGKLETPELPWYTEGVYAYHYRNIGWDELKSWIEAAQLRAVLRAEIRYPWGECGSGAVLEPSVGSSSDTGVAIASCGGRPGP